MWKYYDQKRIDQFVHDLREKYSSDILEVTDHLGRSLLHVAVEQGNHLFAECILSAGFSPNIKEKCGATPLTISMCNKDLKICKLLVDSGAAVRGPLFDSVPCPIDIARKLELAEIYECLNTDTSDDEDHDLQRYNNFKSIENQSNKYVNTSSDAGTSINRGTQGFLTGVVGEVGTCKCNRSVMERSNSFSWVGIITGDFHMKGSIIECCFKGKI